MFIWDEIFKEHQNQVSLLMEAYFHVFDIFNTSYR